jgi:hypothetical protein
VNPRDSPKDITQSFDSSNPEISVTQTENSASSSIHTSFENPIHAYLNHLISSIYRSHTSLLHGDRYNAEYINHGAKEKLNSNDSNLNLPTVSLPPPALRFHEHGSFLSLHTPFSMENEAIDEGEMGEGIKVNKLGRNITGETVSFIDRYPSLTCLPLILQHPLPLQYYARYFLLPEDELEELRYLNGSGVINKRDKLNNSVSGLKKKKNSMNGVLGSTISEKNNTYTYGISDSKQHITPFLFPLPHYTYTLLLQQQRKEIEKCQKLLARARKMAEKEREKLHCMEKSETQSSGFLFQADLTQNMQISKKNLEKTESVDEISQDSSSCSNKQMEDDAKMEKPSELAMISPPSLHFNVNELIASNKVPPLFSLPSEVHKREISPPASGIYFSSQNFDKDSGELPLAFPSPPPFSPAFIPLKSSILFSPPMISSNFPSQKMHQIPRILLNLSPPSSYPALATYSPLFCTLSNNISHTLYTISSTNAFFFYHYYDKVLVVFVLIFILLSWY